MVDTETGDLVILKQTPKKGARIAVAMSGGVDSSTTAAWLKKMGYDVFGITLQLKETDPSISEAFGACLSPSGAVSHLEDAEKVAEFMGFQHHVLPLQNEFRSEVIDVFLKEYLNGRTPNPCAICNRKIKFGHLLRKARELGAEFLATGHYANVGFNDVSGFYELSRGIDPVKDQSYFLFNLRQEDLRYIFFPLGEYTKDQVRNLSRKLNLPIAEKDESQELCFVPDRSYKEFIDRHVPPSLIAAGKIIDTSGAERGQHKGIYSYTIGQRKGLGVSSKVPLFVVDLIRETNEVVVGPEEALFRNRCTVSDLNWLLPPELDTTNRFTAKFRYRTPEAPVEINPLPDQRIEVIFEKPQKALTPGQALVFYHNEIVIGGGWIESFPRNSA